MTSDTEAADNIVEDDVQAGLMVMTIITSVARLHPYALAGITH